MRGLKRIPSSRTLMCCGFVPRIIAGDRTTVAGVALCAPELKQLIDFREDVE